LLGLERHVEAPGFDAGEDEGSDPTHGIGRARIPEECRFALRRPHCFDDPMAYPTEPGQGRDVNMAAASALATMAASWELHGTMALAA
jgi:hypothetical protein